MKKRALLVVETGWKGLREASLDFFRKGYSVDIVVKGRLDKEVRDMISKPSKEYRIRGVGRPFIITYLLFYIFWHKAINDLKMIILSKQRTKDWMGALGVDAKLLTETGDGYELR